MEREDIIAAVQSHIDSDVEYNETHRDAGDAYSHMPAESWETESNNRLAAQLDEHGVDRCGLEIGQIADIALENFAMFPGHRFGPSINGPLIILDSFAIQEHEIWLDYAGLQINAAIIEDIGPELDAYIGHANTDHALAYVTTDAVWYAAISPDDLFRAIQESAQ